MTREELERAVTRDIVNGTKHWIAPEAVAASVIRLVVEACADWIESIPEYGFRHLAETMRHTFLPTTEPTDG